MKTWLLAALMISVGLSGCASGPVEKDDVVPEPAPEPFLEDALAAILAGNQTVNLEVLGAWQQSGEEAAAWQDYLFVDAGSTVRILHRLETDGTFEVEEVASIAVPGPKDVKVSDDGEWLWIGNDEQASAVAGTGIPNRNGGFYTYYIGDKANPELTHYLPVGPLRGPHMVAYLREADGGELVFGANADISINRFDRATGSLTQLSTYRPNPVTEVDRDPYRIDALYQLYAHDMFPMLDNVTGEHLLYVANWDAGLRVLNIDDPANPVEVGSWNDFPAGHSGNIHTVATEWIGERRITVASPEIGFAVVGGVGYALNEEPPVVYVLDTTDLGNVKLLGMWENPLGAKTGRSDLAAVGPLAEPLNSPHNVQLEGGLLYLAHYDLGIFVIDLRTPELQAEPKVLAYHNPGNTWDVIIAQGTIIGSGSYGLVGMGFPLLPMGVDGLFSRA